MFQNLTGWHALIILAIVVLIFGATKLPALAKSVGQSMRILKREAADPDRATTAAAASESAGPATGARLVTTSVGLAPVATVAPAAAEAVATRAS